MWYEEYEKLTNSEKEEFRRLVNLVLSRTFIIRDVYSSKEGMIKVNTDYRFIERHFNCFLDYLSFGGWILDKDNNYGVISLSSSYEYNRVRFDKITTLMLYTIRLIFEEEREKVALRKEVLVTTSQIVQKMMALGLVKKKPSNKDLIDSLRLLSQYNIIQKLEGSWEEPGTKILILPSILFIVTNEKISRMYEMLDAEDETISEEEQEQEVIRGDDDI
ncbi:MAG: DUF4194 domain-containing protein [Acetivibrionales bacterium]|jgi:hypothetical protein